MKKYLTSESKNRSFNFAHNSNANLTQNAQFQFAMKHALSLYHTNSVYSFIPKNGCTTLRASLASANGFLNDIEKQINWLHNNTYTFGSSLKELITSEYTFTVLRCPYARLVSLFLDKFVDVSPVAWTLYRSSNNKYDPDKITLSNFIDLLIQQPNLINADIHWRKQSDFLVYKTYDDYFDFDNFDLIEAKLKKKINLNLIDTRSITGHGRDHYVYLEDKNYSNTSVTELKLLKNDGKLPSIKSMYNDDIRSKINKIYKADFDIRKSKIK